MCPCSRMPTGTAKPTYSTGARATATFYWLTSSSGYSANAARSRPVRRFRTTRCASAWRRRRGPQSGPVCLAPRGWQVLLAHLVDRYSYAIGQGQKQWGGMVNGVPDVPRLGDIDGDGKANLIFARPATGEFRWVTSSSGYSSAAAGATSRSLRDQSSAGRQRRLESDHHASGIGQPERHRHG